MSLTNKRQGIYVSISNGKFAIKNPQTNQVELYDNLTGRIVKVEIKDDTFKGKAFKKAYFDIVDDVETYILQIRVGYGYFRSFCNSLKSGDINKVITISGIVKEENGKSKGVLFVKQDGKILKHFHTKGNMGDLPPVEMINFNGNVLYDNTKEMEYWMNWLKSIKFENPQLEINNEELLNDEFDGLEISDDLPF